MEKRNTGVTIAGVDFKNPVMTASGTFGSGMEYGEFVDLNRLGPWSQKAWQMRPGPAIRFHVSRRPTVV